jgi:hypothetical protein
MDPHLTEVAHKYHIDTEANMDYCIVETSYTDMHMVVCLSSYWGSKVKWGNRSCRNVVNRNHYIFCPFAFGEIGFDLLNRLIGCSVLIFVIQVL